MMEIFSLSNEMFGLEVTDSSVRVMKLARRGREVRVVSANIVPIPAGTVKGGDIKDEAKLVAAIKEAVGKTAGDKIRARHVVFSLQENKAFLQVIKMPKLKNQDLHAAVVFEAENYIPLPLEKVYLDFEVVADAYSQNSANCEVMIAAFPREPIDSLIRAATLAGLVPVAMELESHAILRALSFGRKLESPTVMIQIGDAKTNIIVYADNSIRFTFSIPISNRYFVETIAKSVGATLDKAAVLKRECGIEEFTYLSRDTEPEDVVVASDRQKIIRRARQEENYDRQKIFEALVPGLVDFIQQIKKCITYYQTHYGGRSAAKDNIGKILLCGSGADLKGLDEFIGMKLGTSVEVAGLPLKKDIFDIFEEKNGHCDPCSFAVTFGLALRAMGWGGELPAVLKTKRIVSVPKPPAAKRRVQVKKN